MDSFYIPQDLRQSPLMQERLCRFFKRSFAEQKREVRRESKLQKPLAQTMGLSRTVFLRPTFLTRAGAPVQIPAIMLHGDNPRVAKLIVTEPLSLDLLDLSSLYPSHTIPHSTFLVHTFRNRHLSVAIREYNAAAHLLQGNEEQFGTAVRLNSLLLATNIGGPRDFNISNLVAQHQLGAVPLSQLSPDQLGVLGIDAFVQTAVATLAQQGRPVGNSYGQIQRLRTVLRQYRPMTVGELCRTTEADFLKNKKAGPRMLRLLGSLLAIVGLGLRGFPSQQETVDLDGHDILNLPLGAFIDLVVQKLDASGRPLTGDELRLVNAIKSVLTNTRCKNVAELCDKTESSLLKTKNCGPKKLRLIKKLLAAAGLTLKS